MTPSEALCDVHRHFCAENGSAHDDARSALTAAAHRVEAIRSLHRPDGGIDGPGAMCVECTFQFGTPWEEPVPYPCPTIAALNTT